ncbi:MAG: flagellar export chaperone FliS [Planctomycetes bacterium]|nr:flagellar export chaperone FliS [Planctomycetota bacterium]MBI3843001.1 flagellar export chaperone FliS [Planctomycetota bacterium]
MSTLPSTAARDYMRSAVLSATPLRLIVLLYEGAIRQLRTANRRLEEGDDRGRHAALGRALDIVGELVASLDPKHAPEITADLERHYVYVQRCILQGNLERSREKIDAAIRVLDILRSAWTEIERTQPQAAR